MYLDTMNYLQVREYLKKHDTALIVTGSTENHGKHMPLGTDTFIPSKIAELADGILGQDIIVLPPLPYGSTEDLMGFDGTLSVGPDLLTEILDRLCDQLLEYGFRHVVVLNGHGGNSKSIERSGLALYRKGGLLARVDWWLLAGQLNPAWKGGHGGAEETAGVMAVDPSLIKTEHLNDPENFRNDLGDALPTYEWNVIDYKGGKITVPRPLTQVTDNGWNCYHNEKDFPPNATEEWGKEMTGTMAAYVADFIRDFEKAPLPERK